MAVIQPKATLYILTLPLCPLEHDLGLGGSVVGNDGIFSPAFVPVDCFLNDDSKSAARLQESNGQYHLRTDLKR